jgi:hypothetical protein
MQRRGIQVEELLSALESLPAAELATHQDRLRLLSEKAASLFTVESGDESDGDVFPDSNTKLQTASPHQKVSLKQRRTTLAAGVDKTLERGVSAVSERILEHSLERGAEIAGERLMEKAGFAMADHLLERGVEAVGERIVERSVEAVGERIVERSVEAVGERIVERSMEAVGERIVERSVEAVGERIVERSVEATGRRVMLHEIRPIEALIQHTSNFSHVTHGVGSHGDLGARSISTFSRVMHVLRVLVPLVGTIFVGHMTLHDWKRLRREWNEMQRAHSTVLFAIAAAGDALDTIAHCIIVASMTIVHIEHDSLHIIERLSLVAAVVATLSMIAGEISSARLKNKLRSAAAGHAERNSASELSSRPADAVTSVLAGGSASEIGGAKRKTFRTRARVISSWLSTAQEARLAKHQKSA